MLRILKFLSSHDRHKDTHTILIKTNIVIINHNYALIIVQCVAAAYIERMMSKALSDRPKQNSLLLD